MTEHTDTLADTGTVITVPLNKLKSSPRNARRMAHAEADIEALAASITFKGVLQPPIVEPEMDEAGTPTGFYLVTQDDTGNFNGSIKTLSLNVKQATFRKVEKDNDKAPDCRIFSGAFSGATEFGAAWKKISREDRDYLSVKLDDPSFPAPIYASLIDADEGYRLIWSRSRLAD